jgi:hypothetical protein
MNFCLHSALRLGTGSFWRRHQTQWRESQQCKNDLYYSLKSKHRLAENEKKAWILFSAIISKGTESGWHIYPINTLFLKGLNLPFCFKYCHSIIFSILYLSPSSWFFLVVLEFELRASLLLGRCSITWATLTDPKSHFK